MTDGPTPSTQQLAPTPGPGFSPQSSTPATSEGSLRVCVLALGGELFAVDLRHISEVFEVESITTVPGMPSMLTGVTNLRGTVIPLLDLRPSLALTGLEGPLPFAVVLRQGARHIGMLVDHVPEIRTVSREDLLPAMQAGPAGARPFVASVLRMDERLGGVLEVSQIFAQADGGGLLGTS